MSRCPRISWAALRSPVCGDHPIAPATSRVRLIPMLIISACVGCASSPSLDLPPHPPGALTGSQILPLIEGLTVQQREELLFQEFMSGNVPDFLRRFVPVTLWRLDTEGQLRQIRFEVLPEPRAPRTGGKTIHPAGSVKPRCGPGNYPRGRSRIPATSPSQVNRPA